MWDSASEPCGLLVGRGQEGWTSRRAGDSRGQLSLHLFLGSNPAMWGGGGSGLFLVANPLELNLQAFLVTYTVGRGGDRYRAWVT